MVAHTVELVKISTLIDSLMSRRVKIAVNSMN